MLVLDVNIEHEVHDRDPAARLGPWLALVGSLVPYGGDIQGGVDALVSVPSRGNGI